MALLVGFVLWGIGGYCGLRYMMMFSRSRWNIAAVAVLMPLGGLFMFAR